jgi:hypothetical protein
MQMLKTVEETEDEYKRLPLEKTEGDNERFELPRSQIGDTGSEEGAEECSEGSYVREDCEISSLDQFRRDSCVNNSLNSDLASGNDANKFEASARTIGNLSALRGNTIDSNPESKVYGLVLSTKDIKEPPRLLSKPLSVSKRPDEEVIDVRSTVERTWRSLGHQNGFSLSLNFPAIFRWEPKVPEGKTRVRWKCVRCAFDIRS